MGLILIGPLIKEGALFGKSYLTHWFCTDYPAYVGLGKPTCSDITASKK